MKQRDKKMVFSLLYMKLFKTKKKQLQMTTPIYASLEELFEALNMLENDGFQTTVRIIKYDEKQLPYVETSVSVNWCNEFRD